MEKTQKVSPEMRAFHAFDKQMETNLDVHDRLSEGYGFFGLVMKDSTGKMMIVFTVIHPDNMREGTA